MIYKCENNDNLIIIEQNLIIIILKIKTTKSTTKSFDTSINVPIQKKQLNTCVINIPSNITSTNNSFLFLYTLSTVLCGASSSL